jgi:predicted transcriptional regulator
MRIENYAPITSWMMYMNLTTTQSLIFAKIYSICSLPQQRFFGSLEYLAACFNTSERTVRTALNELCEKGYIKKLNIHYELARNAEYILGDIDISKYQNLADNALKKISRKNFQTSEKISEPTENFSALIYKEEKKVLEKDKTKVLKESNEGLGDFTADAENSPVPDGTPQSPPNKNADEKKRFIPPTQDEVALFCLQFGGKVDPERFYDYYLAQGWKLSNGRMLVDWKAAVRNWTRSGYANRNNSPYPGKGKSNSYSGKETAGEAVERMEELVKKLKAKEAAEEAAKEAENNENI